MAFWETEFPRAIAFQSAGGPGFSTIVNKALSGAEQRNRNWALGRAQYKVTLQTSAAFDANRQQFIELLLGFFFNVGGMADGFRLYDWADHTATNQELATVGGNVQLVKNYLIGGRTYQRTISKPVTSAITDWQGNALPNTVFLTGTTTPVTVDPTTGIVTGTAAGTAVDFQFHTPVRFDADVAEIIGKPAGWQAKGGIVSFEIPMIEVLAPGF
jgi:uncharacterized protein (TIGR02217 family)